MIVKILKVILYVIVALIILLLIAFIISKIIPQTGGNNSEENKKDYAIRNKYFIDGKFNYPKEYEKIDELHRVKSEGIKSNKKTKPIDKIPVLKPQIVEKPNKKDLYITWLGHSSIFMQMHGQDILIDPVFSKKLLQFHLLGLQDFLIYQ